MAHKNYLFTSESVTEGHPDKMCDQISDAILDAMLKKEAELEAQGYRDINGNPACVENVRSAVETFTTTGVVVVMGEVRTEAYVDVQEVVRDTVRRIGYTDGQGGFDANTCGVMNMIHEQSPDIAQGVDGTFARAEDEDPLDKIGAGDQGMMFGYACDETPELMPLPIMLAHKLAKQLTKVRKNGTLDYLRPDGKTQVSVEYCDGKPVRVDTVVISTQHAAEASLTQIRSDLVKYVIRPIISEELMDENTKIFINPTGRFVIGGPTGDSGLTGRKIIVDTYGGYSRHGGGAFSGKDPTKVDRTAAYAARYIAKNVVAAKLADRCEVQIAYAIGVAKPVSVFLETFGTAKVDVDKITEKLHELIDLRPAAIIDRFKLRRPIYKGLASYGHMGREDIKAPWENLDMTEALASLLQ